MQRADARFTGLTTVVAVLGSLLLLPPALNLIDREGVLAGLPVAMVLVFTAWLAIIVVVALLVRAYK
ncbi:hypothetical protein AB0E59_42415 [Lentzea sp. NPDC034063]|uniref:hypothetical protein n=1 Tax=unclassified Lentzea TaxID=2643253 RepID=UPI0033F43248